MRSIFGDFAEFGEYEFMIKILRYGALAVFAVVFVSIAANQTNAQITNILTRMDNHNKALSSLKANVTMSKYNSQLEVSDVTKGKAIYLPRKGKDALVRIDWDDPNESMAVVDKKYVIYRPRLKQAYTGSVNSAKGNAKAGNALQFMSMSRSQLRANYDASILGSGTLSDGTKTDHIELIPKKASDYKSAEIWVDANGMPVQSKITEKNGDTITIMLTNILKNKTIDAKEFSITIPKGTEVLKS